MAEAPYSPVPAVQAQAATQIPQTANGATADAFGAAQAIAWQHLGGAVEHVGDVFEKHANEMQQTLNETESNNLQMDAAEKIGQIKMKMSSLQGMSAANYLPEAQKAIMDIRDQMLKSASNPAVQHYLDSQLTRMSRYSIMDLAAHAGTQAREGLKQSRQSTMELNSRLGAQAQPDEFEELLEKNKQIALATATADNPALDAASKTLVQQNAVDNMIKTKVESMAATPSQAIELQQFWDHYKDKVSDQDVVNKLTKTVNANLLQHGSRQDADAITSGSSMDGFVQKTLGNEGARPDEQSKTSSALGRGQFTNDTWKEVMTNHPELGLTKDGRSDDAQVVKAIRALTSDRAGQIGNNLPTEKNMRMAYFLGAGGAKNFLDAMKQDPTVPANQVVDADQVAANRNVFFDKQGNARTVGEVYAMQTKGYGDNLVTGSGLTADSPQGKLKEMLTQADQVAEARSPGDATYRDMLRSRVQTQWNQVKGIKRDEENAAFNTVTAKLLPDGDKIPTSIDELLSDPDFKSSYEQLNPGQKRSVLNQIAQNAKGETTEDKAKWNSDETLQRFFELKGMARTDPQKFTETNIYDEDMSPAQKKELGNLRLDITDPKHTGKIIDPKISGDIGMLRTMNIIKPEMKLGTTGYNQFVGRYADAIREAQAVTPTKPLGPTEKIAIGSQLMNETVSKGWIFDSKTRAYQTPEGKEVPWSVPPKVSATIAAVWPRIFPGKPAPTLNDQVKFYAKPENKAMIDGIVGQH